LRMRRGERESYEHKTRRREIPKLSIQKHGSLSFPSLEKRGQGRFSAKINIRR
jgi:hypothetical protein